MAFRPVYGGAAVAGAAYGAGQAQGILQAQETARQQALADREYQLRVQQMMMQDEMSKQQSQFNQDMQLEELNMRKEESAFKRQQYADTLGRQQEQDKLQREQFEYNKTQSGKDEERRNIEMDWKKSQAEREWQLKQSELKMRQDAQSEAMRQFEWKQKQTEAKQAEQKRQFEVRRETEYEIDRLHQQNEFNANLKHEEELANKAYYEVYNATGDDRLANEIAGQYVESGGKMDYSNVLGPGVNERIRMQQAQERNAKIAYEQEMAKRKLAGTAATEGKGSEAFNQYVSMYGEDPRQFSEIVGELETPVDQAYFGTEYKKEDVVNYYNQLVSVAVSKDTQLAELMNAEEQLKQMLVKVGVEGTNTDDYRAIQQKLQYVKDQIKNNSYMRDIAGRMSQYQ